MANSLSQTFGAWLASFVVEAQAPQLNRIEVKMSELSDKIDAVVASEAAMEARVTGDIKALTDKVAAGTATPDDLAKLDELKAKLDAVDAAPTPPAGA